MWLLCLSLLIILTGCSSTPIEVKQTEFYLKLNLVDEPIIFEGKERAGLARYRDGWCEITLPRSDYPRCLQHEVRECIEKGFHLGYASYEDCFD